MPTLRNSAEFAAEVGERIADPAGLHFGVSKVLRQADTHLGVLWGKMKRGGSDYRLATEVVSLSAFSAIDSPVDDLLSFRLPEHVGSIRGVELWTDDARKAIIYDTPLEGRFDILGLSVAYFRGADETFVLAGLKSGHPFTSVRIHHIRAWPPLHYGKVQPGATATTMTLQQADDVDAFGRAIRRSGLYAGSSIEFTSGTYADTIVAVTGNTGGVVTWTPTLAGAPASGDGYAIVIPLGGLYYEYLVELTVRSFLARDGNSPRWQMNSAALQRLEQEFEAEVGERDQDRPRTVFAKRRRVT